MKSALFCIASPLQAICAIEAMSYFNIEKYNFIVIDDGARLSQIEYYLKYKGIKYKVIPFHVSAINSFIRIIGLVNFWSGNYDYLFMGDFRLTGNKLECITSVKKRGKVFFLDDGNYIVDLANGTIKSSVITKIRNYLFDLFCRIRHISWRNFYTIYAKDVYLNGFNVIENKFQSLPSKSCDLSNDIYIIGTNPIGKGGYCDYLGIDYNKYLNTLFDTLKNMKAKAGTSNIYYIPHGRDLTKETQEICNHIGVIYKKCTMCIELEIARLNKMPSEIIGFGSSALFTLNRMCPNTHITNLHIRGKNAKADIVYSEIDDMYVKEGISIQIINN